ncbi:Gfo/Idh/MocA family oxidoreductase [Mycolicibacterium sp. S2-37]|uniref:Gfo/Idh/MocA family protein n=1 Tax=Mycolicibacterium sp. S2-37 TaxID=2810297 RepID=UPI001A949D44|nr:Gfo/Idh/MocA family oxidoreductase [Mycolicibacterium sp. S2-37]MBO0680313.1 Gfo/Idh/MocA family oxidoreductase [Mycolicibacterium sp. S2-37]
MKVLVIGTGFGRYAAAPAYREIGLDVEIVSPRDEAAVLQALDAGVDLVSVHSPPFMHVDHVGAAIARGIPVLCDKPFGRNGAEAESMRSSAEAAGVQHFLNFEFRLRPSWAEVKRLTDEGAVGTPTHLHWSWFGNGLRGRRYGWINDRESGGGWIGAYGSHLIDYTRWLFGSEVAECGGMTRIEDPQHPDRDGVLHTATAEDAYTAWFRLQNGATASHDTGFAAAVPTSPRAIVMGDAGSLELIADTRLVITRSGQDPETVEFESPPPRAPDPAVSGHLRAVVDAVRSGTQITPSFDDGVAVAKVMDRLRGNS